MGPPDRQPSLQSVFALAAEQHGVVARAQLIALGLNRDGIAHRLGRGRLHRVHRGVYAVGRPQLTRLGELMAAVLASGPDAALSGDAAAEAYGIRRRRPGPIEVTARGSARRIAGVRVRRRSLVDSERAVHRGLPMTSVVRTLVDLATRLPSRELEAAVNEADKLDLADPEALRAALTRMPAQPGVPALRTLLDRDTFRLTDSDLERRFLRIVRRAGLPPPRTQAELNGFRVDFYWPERCLVVETDGLRYHRTPAQQARALERDQAHMAAGLVPLRFSHAQVAFEPEQVERVLAAAASRR